MVKSHVVFNFAMITYFNGISDQIHPIKSLFSNFCTNNLINFQTQILNRLNEHDITNSLIEMTKILCCRQYKYNTESTGQEEFYLFISKVELLFIRMEIRFEKYGINFSNGRPTLQNEKEERLISLLHILGTSNQEMMKECKEKSMEITEDLHDQIVEKLCKDEE
ncbi:hypothetical protein RFI_32239 [Reticulomyxa filosa]|uniref:Uncharacterized protein n=1 Tax=Reticulomyxa filosa TaxID=46433 RepID=X6LT95_RETFI|nr:hypothetical protein RFI_32239 [Reticulomyxa filosa]|eukprot:ETO05158.1 hypothetical protein RFI_32239 [Reticulomyxa filosa]